MHPAFATAWRWGLQVLKPTPAELERGLELHRSLTICESYGFLPMLWSREALEVQKAGCNGASVVDHGRRLNHLRTVAAATNAESGALFGAALRQAGVHGIVVPVNDYGESLVDMVQRIAAYRHLCLHFPQALVQVEDAQGVADARAADATALIFSLTGFPVFGTGDLCDPAQLLDWVEIFYSLGVRFMHVGYNRRNHFADGCTELNDGGLSDLGRDLVMRMNRVGIVVDVPHSSRNTLREAVALSGKPVTISHATCAAVVDGPRAKRDDEMKAIAATGGYIGICAVPDLLGPNADLALMLRHVAHAIKVVGPEHVVLGTDIGYNQPAPEHLTPASGRWRRLVAGGWNERNPRANGGSDHIDGSLSWTNKPLLTVALVQMGLSDEAIAQIHYGNLCRVLDAATPKRY